MARSTLTFEHWKVLQVGMAVIFGRPNGEQTPGVVVKVNAKSVKIRQTGARGGHADGTVWRVGPQLVKIPGAGEYPWAGEDAPAKTRRSDEEILKQLRAVECCLSPENLTCDGELPKSQVAKRYRALMAQRRILIAELGREPTDKEVYGV